jgi:hypothetical protein
MVCLEKHGGVALRRKGRRRTLALLWSLTLNTKLGGVFELLIRAWRLNFSSEVGSGTPTEPRFSTRPRLMQQPIHCFLLSSRFHPSFVCEVPRPSASSRGAHVARSSGSSTAGRSHLSGRGTPAGVARAGVQSLSNGRRRFPGTIPSARASFERPGRSTAFRTSRCRRMSSSLGTPGSLSIWTAMSSKSSRRAPMGPPTGCSWAAPNGFASKVGTSSTAWRARPTPLASAGAPTSL